MRATNHNSRKKGYASHNDRKFDISKADNINADKISNNVIWCHYDGMNFADAELRYYSEHFQGHIEATNQRAIKSRHKERITSPEKLLSKENTRPEEVIRQIGDKDCHASLEELQAVYRDFTAWHDKKFGNHVKILNYVIHADEKTPHIHERRVWVYDHPDGYKAIGQHNALEQMGYTLPNPDKDRGRQNNLKVPYTAECREKWIDICKEHGLEIESQPKRRAPNKQNLEKGDYIIMQQDKKIAAQQKKASFIMKEIDNQVTAGQQMVDKYNVALQEASELLKNKQEIADNQHQRYKDLKSLQKAIVNKFEDIQIGNNKLNFGYIIDMLLDHQDANKFITFLKDLESLGRENISQNYKDIENIDNLDNFEIEDWDDNL